MRSCSRCCDGIVTVFAASIGKRVSACQCPRGQQRESEMKATEAEAKLKAALLAAFFGREI